MKSISIRMIKAVVAIALLIPGLLCGGFFKALSLAFSDVREKHALLKEHLTPINRTIGSESNPIRSFLQLSHALGDEYDSDPKHHLTNALIIHGDGNLEINTDPGILRFNPMKLILVGAGIGHKESICNRLSDKMSHTGKWEFAPIGRATSASNQDDPFVNQHNVDSIDEALQATVPRRSWTSCKRYHQIFSLARPQAI